MKRTVIGWVFVIPALAFITIFVVIPVIYSLFIVTQSCKGSVCETNFAANLVKLVADGQLRQVLWNTFIFFIIQVPIMLSLALIFALILNKPKLKFKGVFRTAIFLPAVTSLIAYSMLFKIMFATDGIVNTFLGFFGVLPIEWLTHPTWQRLLIIAALLWRWTGYYMILYLSGLQSIDREVFDSSVIDGASQWQQFFYITVPLLKPIILFTTVLSTINALQLFDEPFNIISGSGANTTTMTLSQYIYNLSFVYIPNFGYAAMIAYLIMVIAALLSIIQFKLIKKTDR